MNTHEIIDHLKVVPLFADIAADLPALTYLAEKMVAKSFNPGELIIEEGNVGSEMFILVQGIAVVMRSTVEGEPYKIAKLDGSGRPFFGEGALLASDARSATIQAEASCFCLVLTQEVMNQFNVEHPSWALPIVLRISRSVLERLNKTNRDLVLVYNALVMEIRGQN
jgi:CRP-like cAMP-binding protein